MKLNDKEVTLLNGKIRKVEDLFGHSYFHDDHGYAIGVTTMLGQVLPTPEGLKHFYKNNDLFGIDQIFNRATEHGSKVHQIIEMINLAQEVPIEEETLAVKKDIASYAEWVRSWEPDQMQTEQVVFYKSENMKFAGTVDIVAEFEGRTILIDIKTSNVIGLSAFLQVEAYKKAYEESYGRKIDETLILQLGTQHKKLNTRTPILDRPSNGLGWKVHENPKNWDDVVLAYRMWQMINDGVYPEPPKTVEYASKVKLFDIGDLHPDFQVEAKEMFDESRG